MTHPKGLQATEDSAKRLHSAGISPRTGSNMGSIRTILAAVSGITCIAVVIASSEKSNSCSNCAAFAVRHSVSPGGKVSQLPVGCRLRHRHRPLRRLEPLAYWIEETVSLEVPAPREAAYNVYTDLVRQPEWSPWLKSIEHDREKQTSKWVVQQRGIRISWSAVSTLEIPGVEVQWMSTTGLSNRGRVRFEETGPARCLMTLTLSYNLPYVIAKLVRLEVVEKIVQRTLLSDLERFIDVLSKQPEVIAATTAAQEVTSDKLPYPSGFPQAASEGRTSDGMDELLIAPTGAEPGSRMPPTVSQKAAALGAATATIEAPENDSEARKDNRYGDHAEMLGAMPGLKDSGDLVELDEVSRYRKKGGRRKRWRQRIRRLFRRDRLDGVGEADPGRSETSLGEDR